MGARRRPPSSFPPPAGARAFVGEVGGREHLVIRFEAPPPREWPASLTPTEREVARLVATGASNAEIARQRGRAERTIANQVSSILRKLGLASRAELLAPARDEARFDAEAEGAPTGVRQRPPRAPPDA